MDALSARQIEGDQDMKLSARKVLKSTFKKVDIGAVNVEVMIEIAPGIEVASIITKKSC